MDPRICASDQCTNEFIPTRDAHRACSAKCRDRVKYARSRQDPVARARKQAYDLAYGAANKETKRQHNAAWRAANLEHHRRISREWAASNKHRTPKSWRKGNPTAHAGKQRRRTGRLRELTPYPLDHEQVMAKVAYWGGKCWVCSAPYQAIDHVKPLAKSGLNILANLRPICRTCNSRKRDRWFGPHQLSLALRE